MPIIKIPQSVFDAGKPLRPGWYKAKVALVELKPAKDKTSMNTEVHFKTEGPIEKELMIWINSKFPFQAVKLNAAIMGIVPTEEEPEVDSDDWKGKKLQILVGEQTYQGNLVNNVLDFAEYEKDLNPPDWLGSTNL